MLNLKGYKTVKASKPGATSSGDPQTTRRKKFTDTVTLQLKLLETGWSRPQGQKTRDPRWFWQQGDKWFTGVRYGAQSLIGEGNAYQFDSKADLEGFYNTLKEQCGEGAFDKELKEAAERMKAATAGALEKARKARRAA